VWVIEKKINLRLLLAVVIAAFSFFQQEAGAKELKVGFVYLSSVKDAGWSHAHELGRQSIEKMSNIKTSFVDSVMENEDTYIEAVLHQMAESGDNLIFATSYGYGNAVKKISLQFPNVIFMHCSGASLNSNVGTYFGRMYQARYLTGLVAGAMTKSNIIGYVAAFPIPEVIRGINAFALGARKANPEAKIYVRWTKDWNDPLLEKVYANELVDLKADILAQHQDSPATQMVANKRGIYSIGYNHNMSSFAPEAHLTAAVWDWSKVYKPIVKSVSTGKWKSEDIWWGLKKGLVGIAPFSSKVPEEVRKMVLRNKKGILSNKLSIFSGPVLDRQGNTRIPNGKRATDEELRSMNWFVKGVVGDFDPS
jgi:basic membrane protein A